jgi:hypothetical protein
VTKRVNAMTDNISKEINDMEIIICTAATLVMVQVFMIILEESKK